MQSEITIRSIKELNMVKKGTRKYKEVVSDLNSKGQSTIYQGGREITIRLVKEG